MDLKFFSLNQLYSLPEVAKKRYENITTKFISLYGTEPQLFARAPGRVNLIGEHIDYEGYGVLPFAIEKDCLIAFKRTQENILELNHVNENYPSCKITNDPFGQVEYINDYIKYFVAGYRAATKQIHTLDNIPKEYQQKIQNRKFVGLKLLIQGNVPIAAGLSSSASFVICSAVLTSYVNGFQIFVKKQYLIQQAIKYQKLVGMAAGGMDQSISMLGNRQSALYIQFDPIRSQKVNLPEGYKFVIMNSLVQSKKIQTIGTQYNKRVCQCIAAVRILSKKLGISEQIYKNWGMFKQLQQYLKLDLAMMALLVDQFFPQKVYNRQQIQLQLNSSIFQIFKSVINHEIVIQVNTSYRLYQTAKHVYQQANRVLTFIQICNSKLQIQQKAITLGRLMNQSQFSCKQYYQCSSPQIDQLTKLARQQGALGSRLTGAGWGGCTISLVPEDKVQNFKNKIIQRFYCTQYLRKKLEIIGHQNVVFQTIPATCACLVKLQ